MKEEKKGFISRMVDKCKKLFNDGFFHKDVEGKKSWKCEVKALVVHPTFYIANKLALGWLRCNSTVAKRGYAITLACTLAALAVIPTYGALAIIGYFFAPAIWEAISNTPEYISSWFNKNAEVSAQTA